MGKNKISKLPLGGTKLKKDPGIPKFALKKKEVHDKVPIRNGRATAALIASTSNSFAALAEDNLSMQYHAQAAQSEGGAMSDATISAHGRQFAKVLDLADVIIQVLDARDPLGSRSRVVEDHIRMAGPDKKMVLVLNKIDLVPKPNALAWIRYLRHDYPTIPLSSRSSRTRNSTALPPTHLLTLLKSYRHPHTSLTIGVVGPPNVGKSSLINSLKRSRMANGRGGAGGAAAAADVCKVGAKPGETRELKEVALERGLKIVDSPGIVWGGFQGGEGIGSLNMLDVDKLDDPSGAVAAVLQRVSAESLQSLYSVPQFRDANEFLVMVALSRGRLGKGGVPDIEAAARSVLHDWNSGHIPYHTDPPAVHPSSAPVAPLPSAPPVQDSMSMAIEGGAQDINVMRSGENVGAATFVNKFSEPFDLEGLWRLVEEDVMKEGGENEEVEMEEPPAGDALQGAMEEDGFPMESDDLAQVVPTKRHSSPTPTDASTSTRAPREKKARLRPRYDGNAPDGLAVVDAYERGTMAPSRKKARESAKKKKRIGVAAVEVTNDEVMDD